MFEVDAARLQVSLPYCCCPLFAAADVCCFSWLLMFAAVTRRWQEALDNEYDVWRSERELVLAVNLASWEVIGCRCTAPCCDWLPQHCAVL